MTSNNLRRGALAAVTVVAGLFATAPAQAEWRGTAVFRTHTPACVSGGTYTTGTIVNARYRVPNLLGNGNDTKLTFLDRFYGFAVKRSGAFSSAFLPAIGTGFGSGGGFQWGNTPTVRVVSRSPATLTAATAFVNMQVQITGFDEVAGCTVTLDLALVKRP